MKTGNNVKDIFNELYSNENTTKQPINFFIEIILVVY